MSSPIGQEAVFGVYKNSDDWYDVRTVNIATFCPQCYLWTSILDTLNLAPHSLYILSTEIMIK